MSQAAILPNYRSLAIRATLSATLVAIIFIMSYFSLFYLRDFIFYMEPDLKVLGYNFFLLFLTTAIPLTAIPTAIFSTYVQFKIYPLAKMVALGQEMTETQRNLLAQRMEFFQTLNFIINIPSSLAIFALQVAQGGAAIEASSNYLRFFIWIVSSSIFVAFFQNIVSDRVFNPVRAALRIHTLQNRKIHSIRIRFMVATICLCFSFFNASSMNGFVVAQSSQIYIEELANQERRGLSREEVDNNYRRRVSEIMAKDRSRMKVPPEIILAPDQTSLKAVSQKFTLFNVFFMLFVLAIPFWLEFARSGSLRDEINSVSQEIRSIIRGEASLKNRVNIINFDDFGYMAGYINLLLRYFENMVTDVKAVSGDIISAGQQIASAAQQTDESVKTLMSGAEEVNTEASRQDKEVDASNLRLADLTDSVTKINKNLQEQVMLTAQTSGTAEEFANSVNNVRDMTKRAEELSQELVKVANTGAEAVRGAISSISQISEASSSMSAAMGVITKIASQTNLLSMNAAIEAAHAGDAGKGFAVVANEVRSLSENSSKQSRSIRTEIINMNEKIKNGLEVSASVQEALEQIIAGIQNTNEIVVNIAKAMESQASGAKEIVNSISKLNAASMEVGSQTIGQKSQNAAIQESMRELSVLSESIASKTQEQSEQGQKVSELMSAIINTARENGEKVNQLQEAVNRFNLD